MWLLHGTRKSIPLVLGRNGACSSTIRHHGTLNFSVLTFPCLPNADSHPAHRRHPTAETRWASPPRLHLQATAADKHPCSRLCSQAPPDADDGCAGKSKEAHSAAQALASRKHGSRELDLGLCPPSSAALLGAAVAAPVLGSHCDSTKLPPNSSRCGHQKPHSARTHRAAPASRKTPILSPGLLGMIDDDSPNGLQNWDLGRLCSPAARILGLLSFYLLLSSVTSWGSF